MIKNININDAEVSAELHGYMYLALYDYQGILHAGSRMTAEIVSNNEIKINDGILCNYGRFMRIVGSETVRIENGSSGVKRTDLIVARFNTNGTKETHGLAVIKGPAGGAEPSYSKTDIYSGTGTRDLVLYAVHLNGLNIDSVERKCQEYMSMRELMETVSNQQNSNKWSGSATIDTKYGITLKATWNSSLVEFEWYGTFSDNLGFTGGSDGYKFGNNTQLNNVMGSHTAVMFPAVTYNSSWPLVWKYDKTKNGFSLFTMQSCTIPKGQWISGTYLIRR